MAGKPCVNLLKKLVTPKINLISQNIRKGDQQENIFYDAPHYEPVSPYYDFNQLVQQEEEEIQLSQIKPEGEELQLNQIEPEVFHLNQIEPEVFHLNQIEPEVLHLEQTEPEEAFQINQHEVEDSKEEDFMEAIDADMETNIILTTERDLELNQIETTEEMVSRKLMEYTKKKEECELLLNILKRRKVQINDSYRFKMQQANLLQKIK